MGLSMHSIMTSIREFFLNIEIQMREGATLWLAVSGGRDSMVLLDLVAKLWGAGDLAKFSAIKIVHVNHGVRGGMAKRDANFVARCAEDYGFEFSLIELPFKEGEHKSEAELREYRYREIEFLMKAEDFAATAHHSRDQAETVLLNILRGTGLRGLRGIAPSRGRWLRPMLSVLDSQIQSTAITNELKWIEDETNQDKRFDRNWLRSEIFPKLEMRRPGAVQRLANLAEDARKSWSSGLAVASYRESSVFTSEPKSGVRIASISKFTELPQSLWSEFLGVSLYRKHIEALNLVLRKGFGKVNAPGGMIWVSCGWLAWWSKEEELRQFQRLQNMGSAFESVLGVWELRKGFGVLMKRDDASMNASIKKRLQDAKVPEYLRSCIPLYEFFDKDQERRLRSLIPMNWLNHEEWSFSDSELITYRPSSFATEMFAKNLKKKGS